MVIEAEVLTRVCIKCGVEKPTSEFFASWHNGRKKLYIRNDCKICHGTGVQQRTAKLRNRRAIRKAFQEAPYLAVIRLLKEDPDLMTEVVKRNPLKLKKYLREEQNRIFQEHKERSMRLGKGKVKYTDIEGLWNELEEELKAGILKDPQKRTPIT